LSRSCSSARTFSSQLFTAAVTAHGPHFLEIRGPLLYCHCLDCCSHSIFDQPVQGFLTSFEGGKFAPREAL
jgi:hypothetical protein